MLEPGGSPLSKRGLQRVGKRPDQGGDRQPRQVDLLRARQGQQKVARPIETRDGKPRGGPLRGGAPAAADPGGAVSGESAWPGSAGSAEVVPVSITAPRRSAASRSAGVTNPRPSGSALATVSSRPTRR